MHFVPDAAFPFRTVCGAGRTSLTQHGRARWRSVDATTQRAAVTCAVCQRQMRATETEAQALARGLRDGSVSLDWNQ